MLKNIQFKIVENPFKKNVFGKRVGGIFIINKLKKK